MIAPRRLFPPSTPEKTRETTAAAAAAAAVAPNRRRRRRQSPAAPRCPPHSLPSPPRTPEELAFAKRTLLKLVQDSWFFPKHDKNNRVQTIRESEFEIGSVVGKGGFCEVRCVSLRHRGKGNLEAPRYAMKYLSTKKTASSRVFQRGIADLAVEACFLSLLRHDNIIDLHYVSEGSLDENYNCAPRVSKQNTFGYFLLLDLLHESLADRIDKTYVPQMLSRLQQHTFNNNNDSNNNPLKTAPAKCPCDWCNKVWDRIRNKNENNECDQSDPKAQLAQRLGQLSDIASALKYLHTECHIIFRDVKPDNIGFYRRYHLQCSCGYYQHGQNHGHGNNIKNKHSQCRNNCLPNECTCYNEITKLFDFGLAKELKVKHRKTHPAYPDQRTYKLTGSTGSRRYMAPEVAFSDPYNEKSDVYSFGMLLYQTASLVTPFDGFSMERHEREVLRGGYRPDTSIPRETQQSERMAIGNGVRGGGETEIERRNRLLASRTKQYWPEELPRLMEDCWDCDMRYRPTMGKVAQRLGRCIRDMASRIASRVPKYDPLLTGAEGDSEDMHDTLPMNSHHAFSKCTTSVIENSQHRYQQCDPTTVKRRGGRRNKNDGILYSNISNRAKYDNDGDVMMQRR